MLLRELQNFIMKLGTELKNLVKLSVGLTKCKTLCYKHIIIKKEIGTKNGPLIKKKKQAS